MSQSKILNVPNSIVEQLRCALCKGYLSCAPIQLLPDGRSICGRCSPSTHAGPTYRQLAFEAFLTKTSFPCQFKEQGCAEHIPFRHVAEHENSCPSCRLPCPSLPNKACPWVGSMHQIPDHFKHDHPGSVMQKVEFKIEVAHDNLGVLLAVIDDVAFISKFVYNANRRSLHYDIRSLGVNINGAFYKIRLINDTVCDFSVNLKGDNCFPYNNLFHDMDNTINLNIRQFLPILDNPKKITFALDVVVTKPDHKNRSEKRVLDSAACDINEISNFKVAKLEKPDTSKSKPISPCSWKDCTFVGTPEEVSEHEMTCQFRLYKCTAYKCDAKFTPEANLKHLMSHGFQYIMNEPDFKMVFSKAEETKSVFSLRFNGVIFIQHTSLAQEYRSHHQIILYSCDHGNKQTNGVSLLVEIEHCNRKFKSEVCSVVAGNGFFKNLCVPSFINATDKFLLTLKIF